MSSLPSREKVECKFHNYPYVPEWKRAEKCGCRMCLQSKEHLQVYDKVNAEHVSGKFCKLWTQCEKCSKIKYYTRILRHYAGYKCGRNCPICHRTYEEFEKFELQKATIELYGLLLGVKCSATTVIWYRKMK